MLSFHQSGFKSEENINTYTYWLQISVLKYSSGGYSQYCKVFHLLCWVYKAIYHPLDFLRAARQVYGFFHEWRYEEEYLLSAIKQQTSNI